MKLGRKLLLVVLLSVATLSMAADRDRFNELSQNLMCPCGGCNTTLGYCPHKLDCHTGVSMKAELQQMIDQGMDNKSILAAFASKYGTAILSAPPASGFNLTAWIMPFVALLVGGVIAVVLAQRFRARWSTAALSPADAAKYQNRVEDELQKYNPED